MTSDGRQLVLVVLVGPQASGKSTVASGLAWTLRQRGERVALVELDQVAGMALPTLPSWDVAARIFAIVAGEWARSGLTCVVAEGIASRGELAVLLAQIPASAAVVTVLLTTPFSTATLRAHADPDRAPTSSSRDPGWLAERYDEWGRELSHLTGDLHLDTSGRTTEESVSPIVQTIEVARRHRAPQ